MDIYEQLKRDEGERLKVYVDTRGNLTIGVGRNLSANGIRSDESDFMLKNDVDEVHRILTEKLAVYSKLDSARAGVLLNMAFNLGVEEFLKFFRFLALVNSGDYYTAATDILLTPWAKEVGDRAMRLAQQLRTGEWV